MASKKKAADKVEKKINPYPAPDKTKREGDFGEVVCWIQFQLGIRITGDYDPGTVEAVKRFQKIKDLEPDGVVDKITRAALMRL